MSRTETSMLMNMCMIYDKDGNVVVQRREGPNWPGIAFPGGHVEKGESFTDAVIREVWEETGLRISDLKLCGIQDWVEDGIRYVVFLYKSCSFEGTLTSSHEGEVWWTPISTLTDLPLAESMVDLLRLFDDDTLSESFYYKKNDDWVQVLR